MIDDLETRVLDIYLAHEQLGQLIIDLFQDITGQPGGGGGAMADIEIRDVRGPDDGSLATLPRNPSFEQVKAVFGFEVDRSLGWDKAVAGETVWKLIALELREGPQTYIPQVKNKDGGAQQGILVFRHWPTVDPLPNGVLPNPRYFDKCVGGFTDANGVVGFGFTNSSVVQPGGGPDSIWCSANPNNDTPRSDCLKRMGWLGSTNHLVTNPIFQLTVKSGTTPPPEPPPPGTATYRITGTIAGSIPVDLVITPI